MNQEQNSKLQQQRENLNKKNQEVATMDKRVNELRDRLWKKKAALQQKENLPVSTNRDYARPRTIHRVKVFYAHEGCGYVIGHAR